jgi:hypothetical protein
MILESLVRTYQNTTDALWGTIFQDRGERKLKRLLLPGEVVIRNARSGFGEAEKDVLQLRGRDARTAFEIMNDLAKTDHFRSLRLLPAFQEKTGRPLKIYETIVGIKKV